MMAIRSLLFACLLLEEFRDSFLLDTVEDSEYNPFSSDDSDRHSP